MVKAIRTHGMTTAQRLAERLAPGQSFSYIANTCHDVTYGRSLYAGKRMTVRGGKWVKNLDVEGMSGGFRMEIPRAARDVEWLDEDTVRYTIVGCNGYKVTLRFDPA